MIFIEEQSPFLNEKLVVEEDEKSTWVYLVDADNNILQDAFLCSSGEIVTDIVEMKSVIENNMAPPLMESFRNEFSVQKSLSENDVKVKWVSENEVKVFLGDKEFVRMLKKEKESYCLGVSKDGPYGKIYVDVASN